jgi:Terminase large subunit, T4likevirus-type, N-terminal
MNNDYGKPLDLADLSIDKLAMKFQNEKIRTTTGYVQSLHETQMQVVQSKARYKVLACGRRWGKSILCSLVASAALFQPGRKIWIVAPDYSATEKVFREIYHIFVTQLKLITPAGKDGSRASFQKGEYLLRTPWGSTIEGKSADNPDSLVGESIDLLIFDESALETNLEQIWNQLLQPTLIDRKGSAIFISTPRGTNYFYKLFLLGKSDDEEWESFQFTSYDNPYIPKDEVDKTYYRATKTGQIINFKQEYLADFEAVVNRVFPPIRSESGKYGEHPHIIDLPFKREDGELYIGCDFNYARPASTLYAQVNAMGDVFIFDEDFEKNTGAYKQALLIREKLVTYKSKYREVVGDISGNQVNPVDGRTSFEDMEAVLGHKPTGRKQSRQVGSDMIRLWLEFPKFNPATYLVEKNKDGTPKSYPKLFINKKCVNLIYALQTATFKKGKDKNILKEDYEEHPDGYEGLIDALRYILVYLFHDTKQSMRLMGGF